MIETFVDAMLVLAAWAVAASVAGYAPRARVWGAVGITLGVLVVAAVRDVFRWQWMPVSLLHDVPWGAVAVLGAWGALGRAGFAGTRRWPAVVLLSALVGDLFVATGLALLEPDARRRARLVLAASAASLAGITSGAAPLMLGWGGAQAVGLAVLLACVGFVGGPSEGGAWLERIPAETSERARRLGWGFALALLAGIALWGTLVGTSAEILAERIEALPLDRPGEARAWALGAGMLGGFLGEEGFTALLAREVAARALSVKGTWAVDAARVGICVGGGLPLLVLTKSSLRVGLPLWLLQVALAWGWLWVVGAAVLP